MAEKSKKVEQEEKHVILPKKASDIQRFKLEKLMKNPSKPAYVPERPEEKLPRVFNPPEFIRNVWGSSAGAGSGDFHVYRGIRRRQYAREKFENVMSEKQEKDEEFQKKVAQNKKEAEVKTAKKRAKRLKKKFKQKHSRKQKLQKKKEESSSEDSDEEEEEEKAEYEIVSSTAGDS